MTHIEHVTSEEMRKLCEKATPGPWYQGSWKQPPIEGAKELSDLLCYFDDEEKPRFWNWEFDGEFVAAARTFIPWALSELEQASQREATQKRRIEELENYQADMKRYFSGELER